MRARGGQDDHPGSNATTVDFFRTPYAILLGLHERCRAEERSERRGRCHTLRRSAASSEASGAGVEPAAALRSLCRACAGMGGCGEG